MGKVKNAYWKRVREAKRWQEEQRMTPEEREAHKSDWVERQKNRRRMEARRDAQRRVALKHTLGRAMVEAGVI